MTQFIRVEDSIYNTNYIRKIGIIFYNEKSYNYAEVYAEMDNKERVIIKRFDGSNFENNSKEAKKYISILIETLNN